MYNLILSLMVVVCVLLIIVVAMQPSKTNAASSLTGGAEQLFGKKKVRGVELVLHRATVVLSVLFFALVILLSFFVK